MDFLSKLRKSRQAYFSHTRLRLDASGTDNYGKPVTFWQSLWFAMCSYLVGKDDQLNNAYFFFCSRAGGGNDAKACWFDEYERIDLGKAGDSYKSVVHRGANVYLREFDKGYVFVNPTERDAIGISIPTPSRQLSHDNFRNIDMLKSIDRIDLLAHHATILLKVDQRGRRLPE